MADRPTAPDPAGPSERYPGTPGWVKALGVVAVLVVLFIVFALATGLGGPHGPQRHGASAAVAATPLAGA
jgi:hypothetical protein